MGNQLSDEYKNRRLPVRFWKKVDPKDDANGCWNWVANVTQPKTVDGSPKNGGGYGLFYVDGTMLLSHRVSYAMEHGPIPYGMHVMHKCDNRRCVNPYHLALGTNADNMADRNSKGRQVHLRGESNGHSRMNEEQVRKIRAARASGATLWSLVREYGVSLGCISGIVYGTTWKHVA